jgi:hypothetical protein
LSPLCPGSRTTSGSAPDRAGADEDDEDDAFGRGAAEDEVAGDGTTAAELRACRAVRRGGDGEAVTDDVRAGATDARVDGRAERVGAVRSAGEEVHPAVSSSTPAITSRRTDPPSHSAGPEPGCRLR